MKSLSTPVYWDTLRHQDWTFRLAATSDGLCCVTLPNETLDTLSDWLEKHVPGAVRTHDRDRLAPYVEQMKAYLDGRTQAFSVPLDFRGTPFQIRVWRALLQIPFGSIRSYTDLAASIGHPAAVRAVAAACGANPMPIVVPCHRVIGKDGRLTGYRGGLEMKAKLLRMEGIALG